MENFVIYNPTKLHFGKQVINGLGKSIAKHGKRVLLVYGGGSIKKYGIYEQVMKQLDGIGAEVYEYSGIRPNPVIGDVDSAASLGRQKDVDVVLAVGGGSVIDSAKIISITIPVSHSGWEFMKDRMKPKKAVPLIAILTLAATGTEMNRFAVVQKNETREKIGFGNSLLYPKESFLDPAYTLSVSKDYTAYGIVDLTAHCLESFFGEGNATLSDKFVYAIIREGMRYGIPLVDDLDNYILRERIMYASTNALNNLTAYGRKSGDWGVHSIGHVLSVLYDIPHGASLSIVYPAWLKHFKKKANCRISDLGRNIFSVKKADDAIFELEEFFRILGTPLKLSQIGINADREKQEIFETMVVNEVSGNHYKLGRNDYWNIIDLMA